MHINKKYESHAMCYFWIHNYLLLERSDFKKKGQSLNKDDLLHDKISPLNSYKMSRKEISEHLYYNTEQVVD